MKRSMLVPGLVAATLLLGGVSSWAGENNRAAEATAPPAEKAAKPAQKSVTVFPVVIKPELPVAQRKDGPVIDMSKRIAAVLGLFLEKAGIENIELAEAKFSSPDTQDVARIAADFGKLVREKPIRTEYAVYGEILGTPQTGPKEIRTIVVDKQGKVILADRDDRKSYSRTSNIRPKDPMTCTLFIAKKAQKLWGLADPLREDAPKGKMAEYWRKQSGLPSEDELADIKQRRQVMKERIKKGKFTVYPVRIGTSTDRECAVRLAALLNEQNVCQTVVSEVDPKLQIQGDPNEQKVLWDAARAFRRFLRENPTTTDYVLYADYFIGRSSSGEMKVGHVHFIVCDRADDWVIVDYQNSHHRDFQSINPKSKEDCNRLVVQRLKGALSE